MTDILERLRNHKANTIAAERVRFGKLLTRIAIDDDDLSDKELAELDRLHTDHANGVEWLTLLDAIKRYYRLCRRCRWPECCEGCPGRSIQTLVGYQAA